MIKLSYWAWAAYAVRKLHGFYGNLDSPLDPKCSDVIQIGNKSLLVFCVVVVYKCVPLNKIFRTLQQIIGTM